MTPPPVPTAQREIPPELDRWNWGAFLLNWIWGLGNGTYIALLTLVPVVGILVMPFVLGFKGSAWAWRDGRWDSPEHFRRVQRLWAIWGLVVWMGFAILFGGLAGGVFYALRSSDAYALSTARIAASPEVADALGSPLSMGFPSGSISVGDGSGTATLNYGVTGPKGRGQAFVEARRRDGIWSIGRLVLTVEGRDAPIDVMRDTRASLPDARHARM